MVKKKGGWGGERNAPGTKSNGPEKWEKYLEQI